MPELPEVITIREDLKKEILGKKVAGVRKAKNYPLKHSPKEFQKKIIGHKVTGVSNIAKLLLIEFESGEFIAAHLNMSGILLFNKTDPYIKISLEFDTGDKLHYSTVRMFGYFEVWSPQEVNLYKNRYGKTAIESDITKEEFAILISEKKMPIKTALLDQKVVSGIGNIYANDALYMSGIHPKRKANGLSTEELYLLFENVQTILMEGIKNRGSSIDRYRDLYGNPGRQQEFFRIYGKNGSTCLQCQSPIRHEKMQGRGTFFCEVCQPLDNRPKLL